MSEIAGHVWAWIWAGVCLPRRNDVALLSLGWNLTRGRSQKKSATATVVVQHLARLCRKSTATGGEPNHRVEWHTLELQKRFRERTRAEDFGLLMMCYRSLALGGGAHVLRSSLASTRQMIWTSMHDAARFSPVSTHSQLRYPRLWAVTIASVAFNFPDSRVYHSQTWSAIAHWPWLFTALRECGWKNERDVLTDTESSWWTDLDGEIKMEQLTLIGSHAWCKNAWNEMPFSSCRSTCVAFLTSSSTDSEYVQVCFLCHIVHL